MAKTFELISAVTIGSGGASSIEFTSLASTWTDLVLKCSTRVNSSGTANTSRLLLKINSTTTGYTNKLLYATGTSPASASSTEYLTFHYADADLATANTFSNTDIYIPNYAGSTNKSISVDSVTENNSSTGVVTALSAGLLSNTAAITSLTISDSNAYNFLQYSTAYLYGVKNA